MAIDSGLTELLETAQLVAGMGKDAREALYQEAYELCKNDVPGNFIHLRSDEPESAIILGWVNYHYTRQPRTLFVPDQIIQTYGALLQRIDHGNCIRSLNGLLNIKHDARNWLGMVSLVYAGESMSVSRFWNLMELLERQFVEKARIILVGNEATLREIQAGLSSPDRKCSSMIHGARLTVTLQISSEVNKTIPASLVADFSQDDPVARGLTTLMSSNERFQLYHAVRNLLPLTARPIRFIEVGSFAGGTFYEICRALQRCGLPFQGIAVEPDGKPSFHEVMKYFSDNAVHLAMYSHEAAQVLDRLFSIGSLPEFILIDGDHSYGGVCSDINDYYPLLAPGGIIMFHDYLPPVTEQNRDFIISRSGGTGPGIGDACRELLEERLGLNPLELPRLYPSNPAQTLASQAIIPGVYSTIRAYRKPVS